MNCHNIVPVPSIRPHTAHRVPATAWSGCLAASRRSTISHGHQENLQQSYRRNHPHHRHDPRQRHNHVPRLRTMDPRTHAPLPHRRTNRTRTPITAPTHHPTRHTTSKNRPHSRPERPPPHHRKRRRRRLNRPEFFGDYG